MKRKPAGKPKFAVPGVSIRAKMIFSILIPIIFMIVIGMAAYSTAERGMREKYDASTMESVNMVSAHVELVSSFIRGETTKYAFDENLRKLTSGFYKNDLLERKYAIDAVSSGLMSSQSTNSFTGHLFEGRYTACIIEDERYFLEVSRYIHLNPVKAKMVREPLDYEYSSYPLFMSDGSEENVSKISSHIAELVDTSRVLSCFRTNPKEQYRMFVEGKISHEEQELLIQKDMKEDEMWLPWQDKIVSDNNSTSGHDSFRNR